MESAENPVQAESLVQAFMERTHALAPQDLEEAFQAFLQKLDAATAPEVLLTLIKEGRLLQVQNILRQGVASAGERGDGAFRKIEQLAYEAQMKVLAAAKDSTDPGGVLEEAKQTADRMVGTHALDSRAAFENAGWGPVLPERWSFSWKDLKTAESPEDLEELKNYLRGCNEKFGVDVQNDSCSMPIWGDVSRRVIAGAPKALKEGLAALFGREMERLWVEHMDPHTLAILKAEQEAAGDGTWFDAVNTATGGAFEELERILIAAAEEISKQVKSEWDDLDSEEKQGFTWLDDGAIAVSNHTLYPQQSLVSFAEFMASCGMPVTREEGKNYVTYTTQRPDDRRSVIIFNEGGHLRVNHAYLPDETGGAIQVVAVNGGEPDLSKATLSRGTAEALGLILSCLAQDPSVPQDPNGEGMQFSQALIYASSKYPARAILSDLIYALHVFAIMKVKNPDGNTIAETYKDLAKKYIPKGFPFHERRSALVDQNRLLLGTRGVLPPFLYRNIGEAIKLAREVGLNQKDGLAKLGEAIKTLRRR